MFFFLEKGKRIALVCLTLMVFMLGQISPAFAVVGKAEKFDEFKERDLKEFQEALINEEKKAQMQQEAQRYEDMQKMLKEKREQRNKATGQEKEALDEQIHQLEKELLGLPKRDRLHFGADGDYTYDSNVNRAHKDHKGEHSFNTNANVEIDLSGRKTDLRLELAGGRQWNIKNPNSDFWTMEERLRYRRRMFKKISHSINSRIARTSSRTVEIDDKRIRWDSDQQTSINYILTPKFSLNGDFSLSHRVFTQEAFDQDSGWQASMSPSLFWHFTPKSRVSIGYNFGMSRNREKGSDSDSHGVHMGYFGKITNKSSASFDIGYNHQRPLKSDGGKSDGLTVGLGYIWQATPKTQFTLQYVHGIQNTTSQSVQNTDGSTTSSDTPGSNTDNTVRQTSYFVNDNISLSMNNRLTRKLTSSVTTSAAFTRTRTSGGQDSSQKRHEFSFPTTVSLTYLLNRWARLRLSYTFSLRVAQKRSENYTDHTLNVGLGLRF